MRISLPLLALPILAGCATLSSLGSSGLQGKWTLSTIDNAAAKSERAGVQFLPERISASAGCNGLGGEYTIKYNRLMTGPFMSTKMYCDGLMDQESALAALFEAQPAYRIESDRLTLEGGGHRAVLKRVR